MSHRAGLLQNFAGPIALVIAGGVLGAVFKLAQISEVVTPKDKPECKEVIVPGTKLRMYNDNPECRHQ